MTDSQAYKILINHNSCIRNRHLCLKNCSECNHNCNDLDVSAALVYVLQILKARCPELYFAEHLLNLTSGGNISNE